MATQADRHLAVMALLDISLGQWIDYLKSLTEDEILAMDPELGDPIAEFTDTLARQATADPEEKVAMARLYVQTIAMLNDDNLIKIVTMVRGD